MMRKANGADVLAFVPLMREEDKQEIGALSGLDPLASVSLGLFQGSSCMVGFGKDDELVGMWGVVPIIHGQIGSVWFLSTDAVVRNAREVVTEGRKWLDEQNALYPVLTNVVTESNEVHKRLIKSLGFEFKEPIDNYGAAGVRVIPFERKLNV